MLLDPYRAVLRLRGMRSLMVVGMFARVPATAAGVTLTLHVVFDLHGSYGAAGLVGALTTVGSAVGAPLLGRMVEQSALSRSAFVQSLGYKNVAKGLRALDHWLETAQGPGFVLENLVKIHHLDPVVLRNALEETGRQRRREEEQARIAQ